MHRTHLEHFSLAMPCMPWLNKETCVFAAALPEIGCVLAHCTAIAETPLHHIAIGGCAAPFRI